MNIKVPNFLTNKYVLYLVVFLSVTNMFGYLAMANINALIYFLIIGLATSVFTQNMCIILLSALILSNILIAGQSSMEGFTSKKEGNTNMNDTVTKEKEKENTTSTQSTKKNSSQNTPTSNVTKIVTPINPDEEVNVDSNSTENEILNSTSENVTDEPFEVGMANGNKQNYRVDYASSIQDAYQQTLDTDGIKRLTEDTQKLLKQQLQLADAMKTIAPLINNIKPLIEQSKGLMDGVGGLDVKNLGTLASSAKSFMPSTN